MKKSKRTLSLILALVMLCSTMGVMAFAAGTSEPCHFCEVCGDEVSCRKVNEDWQFNRVIVCEKHNETHDAEEYYVHVDHYCPNCGYRFGKIWDRIDYICLL